jgi:hypothetical protein
MEYYDKMLENGMELGSLMDKNKTRSLYAANNRPTYCNHLVSMYVYISSRCHWSIGQPNGFFFSLRRKLNSLAAWSARLKVCAYTTQQTKPKYLRPTGVCTRDSMYHG